MAWWKSTKRQRGWVKAHEAKDIGRYARRAEDRATIAAGIEDAEDTRTPMVSLDRGA